MWEIFRFFASAALCALGIAGTVAGITEGETWLIVCAPLIAALAALWMWDGAERGVL